MRRLAVHDLSLLLNLLNSDPIQRVNTLSLFLLYTDITMGNSTDILLKAGGRRERRGIT